MNRIGKQPLSQREISAGSLKVVAISPRQIGFIVLAFVIAPYLLLLRFWRTRSWTYRHWLLTAFVTAYGSTISIRYDPTGIGADGVRHLMLVYDYYVGMSWEQFLLDLWSTVTLQTASHPGIRDPYKHIVSFFVGGVLGAPVLFFTVIAFVYGYFFSGSLIAIFRNFSFSKINYVILFFGVLLLLVKNVEGINTVRTWTGLWVLVYGVLKYIERGNNRYLLLVALTPFIHFAYWVMVLPALFVLIFGNRPALYAILFVATSFTTILQPGVVTEAISTTEIGERSVESYYLEERVEIEDVLRSGEGQRWYRVFQRIGVQKWGINVFVYTLLLSFVYFRYMSREQRTMFSIGILTLALSNSTWFLFALSNRSWIIGAVFVLAAFIMWRSDSRRAAIQADKEKKVYRFGMIMSMVLLTPFFLYNLSTLLDFPSAFMFVAPFLVWLDPGMNMSLKFLLQTLLGLR